jgi:hypothetical protein
MADETPSQDASTRWIETSRGILRYSELAPLLAQRVLRVQEQIETGAYGAEVLDERLIGKLHQDFCADLVPDWSGKWPAHRTLEGTAGSRWKEQPRDGKLMSDGPVQTQAGLESQPPLEPPS